MGLDIELHPKQLLALTSPATEILYGGAVGGGKSLALDTPIITTKGWKTMGTLSVGDQVFDEKGVPCNVVAKSEIELENTYEIEFDHNRRLICDGNHEWVTVTRNERHTRGNLDERKQVARTTLEIQASLTADEGRANHSIRCTLPLQFPKQNLPVDPYFFGMWLNGGFIKDRKRTKMVQQAVARGSYFQLSRFAKGKYVNIKNFEEYIAKAGVKPECKYIPAMYLYGSAEDRLSLLKGYLDITGTVDNRNGIVETCVRDEAVLQGLVFIVNSLGMKAYIRRDHNEEGIVGKLRFQAVMNVFGVVSRGDKLHKGVLDGRNVLVRRQFYIKNVTKVDDVPKQCIQVDSPSHMYLAGSDLIPTHNSYLMRVASIVWAMEYPGLQIYLFRITRKELDDNHMVGSGGYYELLGEAVKSKFVKINQSAYKIEFKNGPGGGFMGGSIIHLCHCQYEKDKYNYRGSEMDVLMIDEATHFTWTKYAYLRTRVRRPESKVDHSAFDAKWGKNFFPRILLGSNPGGCGHNKFRSEFVKLAPPLVITKMPDSEGGMLRQYIPATLDDNPSLNKEEYRGKVMGVGNEAVARMLLEGDWDAVAGGMFDDVWDSSVHLIEPFVIPASWYVDRSLDWGSAVPFSVGWYAESDGTEATLANGEKVTYPAGTIFRVAEWYGWNGNEDEGLGLTPYEVGKGIRDIEKSLEIFRDITKFHAGAADNQIWNTNPKFDSAYLSIAQELNAGYHGEDSKKLFDIFIQSDKSQGSNTRGWSAVRTYLKNSLNYPIIDRKCIFFFNTCRHVARVLPTIERDENNLEEIAKGQEDHVMDEIKYRLTQVKQLTRKLKTTLG